MPPPMREICLILGFSSGCASKSAATFVSGPVGMIVTCAALYAAVPMLYKPENKDGSATSFRQELTGNDIK